MGCHLDINRTSLIFRISRGKEDRKVTARPGGGASVARRYTSFPCFEQEIVLWMVPHFCAKGEAFSE